MKSHFQLTFITCRNYRFRFTKHTHSLLLP
nr:MAG TPA: hypothetical protein [Caudoviricetes sp.]